MSNAYKSLVERAAAVFPGGSLGAFALPSGQETVITHGRGSHLYDGHSRNYLDYILGSGPMILGHAHPSVVAAVRDQLGSGSTFYTVNEAAVRLAEKVLAATGWAEMLKFTSSGSEATLFALRLARAHTGRDRILKFEGAYHGHHDYVMLGTTPAEPTPFPRALPDTAGIPRAVADSVLVAPYNDLDATVALLERHADETAAVIVEPGCRLIEPAPGFLAGLRAATQRLGIVLVFDEVVTGFRVAYGGSRAIYDVTPDLICFGKIIGGGFPLAAVAGRREILDRANPRKRGPEYVYVSGTLNGNPIAAVAGHATLLQLERPGVYERLDALGERLRDGIRRQCAALRLPVQVLGRASMLNLYFTAGPIDDYRSARAEDARLKEQLGRELLAHGILTNLAAKMYLSLAHSDTEIDYTIEQVGKALERITNS